MSVHCLLHGFQSSISTPWSLFGLVYFSYTICQTKSMWLIEHFPSKYTVFTHMQSRYSVINLKTNESLHDIIMLASRKYEKWWAGFYFHFNMSTFLRIKNPWMKNAQQMRTMMKDPALQQLKRDQLSELWCNRLTSYLLPCVLICIVRSLRLKSLYQLK